MLALNQIAQRQASLEHSPITNSNAIKDFVNETVDKSTSPNAAEDDDLEGLINIWRELKDRRTVKFSWSNKVQYQIFKFDHSRKLVSPCVLQNDLVRKAMSSNCTASKWRKTSFQHGIEALPVHAYSPQLIDFLRVELDLALQRKQLESMLDDAHACFTFSCGPTSLSHSSMNRSYLQSAETSNSNRTLLEVTSNLAITFNAHDLREARYLHDQLCVLGPVMLALTASNPTDVGNVSNDFMPSHGSANEPNNTSTRAGQQTALAISPSPYLSADTPGSASARCDVDQRVFWRLRREGFDDILATFFARNSPARLAAASRLENGNSSRRVELEGSASRFDRSDQYVSLHFPILGEPDTGFAVEFRAMNVQLTDFANASCIFFVALLRFAILGFDLDFRMPPDLVADNLRRCCSKDAILTEKFWWRMPRWRVRDLHMFSNDQYVTTDMQPTLAPLDHIMNGDPARPETIGLSGVLEAYLADSEDGRETRGFAEDLSRDRHRDNDDMTISKYLAFLRTRAKGTTWTDARWMDNFIRGHPNSLQGGHADPEILFDLLSFIKDFHTAADGISPMS